MHSRINESGSVMKRFLMISLVAILPSISNAAGPTSDCGHGPYVCPNPGPCNHLAVQMNRLKSDILTLQQQQQDQSIAGLDAIINNYQQLKLLQGQFVQHCE